ncbi:MAG TPA: carboxypeptidase regulatory-like domain-containing protein [Tepidisphaeraceae bacterium]|jgi:plastocyanin|nr:carboxypeptidase regulatory-like domain-containing protein [Tepidisphaeraceae bacterium]
MSRLALHLLTLLAAIGCDKPDAPAPANLPNPAKPPTTTPATPPIPGIGAIRGKVILTGWTAPPPAAQMVNCGAHQIPIVNQKVVLKNNGLENVVIYLKDAPPSPTIAIPAPVVLDQIQCVYVPHVLALRTGQTLTIKSSDDLLHNIHMLPQINPQVNFGMTRPTSRDVVLKSAEIFPVKCDVHHWMMAHIAAFDHPWFAVSANGGRFEIPNVPAGPQTFVAWHEQFGEIEQMITVTADKDREITFNFQPPQK